jgi:flagellar hook assembly protein FlgD
MAHHFQLQVTRATRSTLQLLDVAAQMGASGKGVGPVSANIHYTLTANATVEVRILKQGRSIRTLEPGDTRAAGGNDLVWDLKNDRGILVPSDVYTVEVRAIDSNGHMVHSPSTLVITR